jgi:hypothetical protein
MTSETWLRPAARAALAVCLLAVTWLAFTPQPDPPGLGWDKLNHLGAFMVLAALADLAWPGRAALPWRLALLLGYGLLIEGVQELLHYRQGSALDFVADALGIALWLGARRLLPLRAPRWRGSSAAAVSRAAAGAGRSAPAGSRRSPGG